MLIEDIAKYIDAEGYGTYYDTGFHEDNNVFLNNIPQDPNDAIAIYDNGGAGNIYAFTESIRRVQVFVRKQSQRDAHLTIWAIYESLINTDRSGFLVLDGRRTMIRSVGSPAFIGKDNNGLFQFSANFDIWTNTDL